MTRTTANRPWLTARLMAVLCLLLLGVAAPESALAQEAGEGVGDEDGDGDGDEDGDGGEDEDGDEDGDGDGDDNEAAFEPTRFTGQTVVSIGFQAPRGIDVDELLYLLDQDEGQPYDPQRISRSVDLLFRLGQFDDVQVRARPVDGGVAITFVVVPSPRLRRIVLKGVLRVPEGAVRTALSRAPGDPYVQHDELRLARELEDWYRARGFLDAKVTQRLGQVARRGKVIELTVEEGVAYRISDIRVPGAEFAGYDARYVRRVLGPRFRVGGVYRETELQAGVQRVLERYREAGYVEARLIGSTGRGGAVPVDIEIDRATQTVAVSMPIDAGRYVEADYVFTGPELRNRWGARRLAAVIGLDSAHRASVSYAEDAARQLERFLWRQGRFHARVDASLIDRPFADRPSLSRPGPRPSALAVPVTETVRVLRFDIEEGPRVRFTRSDIEVIGNRFLSKRQVVAVLRDASPSVLGHRDVLWQVLGLPIYRPFYTEGELQGALDVLRDYYRARGYLSVGLEHDSEVPPERDRDGSGRPGTHARLRLLIDEGIQTVLEAEGLEFDVRVPIELARVAEWKKRYEDKPYNPASIELLVQDVRRDLAESGYIDAEVAAVRELSDDRRAARVRIEAEPGVAVRFGQVVVRENRHTQVGLIRQEATPLRPGDVYRPSSVSAAQRRLLRTGLFDGVVVQPAQTGGRVRDVELLVNERKRFSFVLGAGVTAPDDGPRVSGEFRLRNLDGRGLSLWTRWRLNLDWRNLSALSTLRPEFRGALGIELPYIPGVPLRAAITGVISEELDEPTYRLSRSSVTASLGWRATDNLSLDLRLEFQFRAPLRVDPAAQLSLPADIPTNKPFADAQFLVLLGASAVLDLRDDRFNPSEGIYVLAAVDTTPGKGPNGEPGFGRATARFVGLIPVAREQGIGIEIGLGGGIAWSYDGLLPPVEWRFRLGGTGTLRGFALDSVGPTGTRPGALAEVGLLTGAHPEREISVGGNAFYRYSIEFQFPAPVLDGWRLAVFHDAGNALIYGQAPADVDRGLRPVLHPSVGIGLRRITPIGPLRLDVAVRPENLVQAGRVPAGDIVWVHFAVGAL